MPVKPAPFDAHAAGSYAQSVRRQVPGHESLLRMVSLLLCERTPQDGRVLVLGAGGGEEIRALAEAQPLWSFDGVDPSADMLALAADTVEPHAARVTLHEGVIEDAPDGPFDAATALLTFHFIPQDKRLETLRQLRRRLRQGAPLILVHLSFPQQEPERSLWIARHVAYGQQNAQEPAQTDSARHAIATRLTILSPQDDVAMLQQAGFSDVSLFYAGMSIKGWVAYVG